MTARSSSTVRTTRTRRQLVARQHVLEHVGARPQDAVQHAVRALDEVDVREVGGPADHAQRQLGQLERAGVTHVVADERRAPGAARAAEPRGWRG